MRAASLVTVLSLACARTGAEEDRPVGGAPFSGRADAALLVGSPTPTLVSLDDAHRHSIGAFTRGDVVRCTGTVVAPRRVLTAAHCLAHEPDLGPFDFTIESDTGAAVTLPIQYVEVHASLDVAIATLGADSATTPIPIRFDDGFAGDLPNTVEAAGAGLGSGAWVSFGIFHISTVEATHVLLTGEAGHGLCGGDSGGPVLQASATGGAEVIAIASTSAPNCGAPALAVRTSPAADWIQRTLAAPLPEPSGACDDARDLGRCRNAVGESCRAGWWRARECAAEGLFCGALPGGGDGCLPAPCGNVDRHGLCDGGAALWCDDRGLEQLDCAARGLGCGFDATVTNGGGNRCLDCTSCDGQCVDFRVNTDHCGECGNECEGDCLAGRCVLLPETGGEDDHVHVVVLPPTGCQTSRPGRAEPTASWLVALGLIGLLARRIVGTRPFWRSGPEPATTTAPCLLPARPAPMAPRPTSMPRSRPS